MHLKQLITIFFSLALIVLLFTAIGCKKKETKEEAPQPAPAEVTYEPATTTKTETEQKEVIPETSPKEMPSTTTPTTPATTDEEKLLLDQAEKLAEIYGTYTNKDKEPYKNLKDLKQYSTEKLQKWFDEKSKMPVDPAVPFYGVTTKAISSAILEGDASKKKILVTTKREEITATSKTPKISFRLLLMDFEKIGEDWKLAGVYWQS